MQHLKTGRPEALCLVTYKSICKRGQGSSIGHSDHRLGIDILTIRYCILQNKTKSTNQQKILMSSVGNYLDILRLHLWSIGPRPVSRSLYIK